MLSQKKKKKSARKISCTLTEAISLELSMCLRITFSTRSKRTLQKKKKDMVKQELSIIITDHNDEELRKQLSVAIQMMEQKLGPKEE